MLVGGDWNMTFMFQYFGNNHEESSQLTIVFFRAFETTNQVCLCVYVYERYADYRHRDGWMDG